MSKLLLVEDNEINRGLLDRGLERTKERAIRQSRRFANATIDSAKGVTKTPAVRVAFALRNRYRSRNHL